MKWRAGRSVRQRTPRSTRRTRPRCRTPYIDDASWLLRRLGLLLPLAEVQLRAPLDAARHAVDCSAVGGELARIVPRLGVRELQLDVVIDRRDARPSDPCPGERVGNIRVDQNWRRRVRLRVGPIGTRG